MRGEPQRTPVTINGQVFVSLSEAARTFGVSRQTVHRALRRGTLGNVGVGPGQGGHNARQVEVDGVTYPTIAAASKATGMTRHKLTMIAEAQG